MNKNKKVTAGLIIGYLLLVGSVFSMPLRFDREAMIKYTPKWEGERFPDGRPKVPDSILERMKNISVTDAWTELRKAGYDYQFERGWKQIHPGSVLIGRAMTSMYMPRRPVVFETTTEIAHKEGHTGNQVSWPINMLVMGDVYVADVYGKELGGPIIGASLANGVFENSGNGVVFDGEIRDLTNIEEIEGLNGFVRDFNPSSYTASMLMGINIPTRIGSVTVMPGDVVLGRRDGPTPPR